jgi:hypothetical protein
MPPTGKRSRRVSRPHRSKKSATPNAANCAALRQEIQEESSFSEEKEAKRLLKICRGDCLGRRANGPGSKSFLVLFFKKERVSLMAEQHPNSWWKLSRRPQPFGIGLRAVTFRKTRKL